MPGTKLFQTLSKKLFMAVFSILCSIFAFMYGVNWDHSPSVLVIAIPTIIASITMICAIYITGQAKVDLNATWGNKDDEQV